MQVSLEQTSELGRKLTIAVSTEKVEAEITERLNSLKSRIKIDGFRPGRVPMNIVRQRYGVQVRQEVMSDQLQSSYRDALQQEKLRPACAPAIETQQIEKGKDFTFTASFDVYPEIKLCDFSRLDLTVAVSEVTDENVEQALESMRKQRTVWQAADTPAEKDQRVTIDFTGKIDGQVFNGGTASDFAVTLGAGDMPEGFEEALLGLKAGENRNFAVTYPDDHMNSQLAGKSATFDVTVKKVESGRLPEVDQAFISALGIEGTVETLKNQIRKFLEEQLQQQIHAGTKQSVMQLLLDNNEFVVPETMVTRETAALRQQALNNFKMQPESNFPQSRFTEQARRRVKLGLIISEIVSRQKLQVDSQRVAQYIAYLASQHTGREQIIQYYQNNHEARAGVESLVMEDQVVEWILAQVNKQEVKKQFNDIVE